MRCSDTVLMTHHGSVTLGSNLMDAYKKLDMVEHTARILYLAHTAGPARPLPPEYVRKLLATRELTSAGYSRALGRAVGFVYARGEPPLSDAALLGARFEIDIAGKRFAATARVV